MQSKLPPGEAFLAVMLGHDPNDPDEKWYDALDEMRQRFTPPERERLEEILEEVRSAQAEPSPDFWLP